METATKETSSLEKFEGMVQIVKVNRPVIAEKIAKAVEALRLITVIETEEQDTFANNVLVKCNATLPVVEGLRKEYTSLVDAWKKSEMADETLLKAEMERVRKLRDERANRIAQDIKEKQEAIKQKEAKDIEIARIKNEQVNNVLIGIANRIQEGERSIAKLFETMTLETIDKVAKQLDFTPKLKEEFFKGLLMVEYDDHLITYAEFKEIFDKAYVHFDYEKSNAAYSAAVLKVVAKWKALLPEKRKELEVIAAASAEQKVKLEREAKDKAVKEAQERDTKAKAEEEAIRAKSANTFANETLDAQFKGQVASQEIEDQEGTRNLISYRLKDEAKLGALQIANLMSLVMINVLADPNFKGIFKRDKGGMIKRDDKGNGLYIDAVQDWLDLLAKVRPSPDFEGVVKTIDVATVAKSK